MKTLKKILQISLLIMLFIACSNDDEHSLNPTIANISPTSGPKATLVTINGQDFGTDVNAVNVYFNDVEASVQMVTDTQITVEVPAKAFTGLVKVMLNGTELIGPEFTYTISDIQVTTLAGNVKGFADGTGTSALFDTPVGLTINTQGNLYVVDANNHKIRVIMPNGVVSTISGSTQGFADGTGTAAKFNFPFAITTNAQGNMYVADFENHKIRKITPSFVVSTVAGSTHGFSDGQGTSAQFSNPAGLAIDTQGNLYVADFNNNRIRKITPSGEVSTLAGSTSGFADGIGTVAQFFGPAGLAIDTQGNLYVSDFYNNRIRKITPSGEVSTLAGSTSGFSDGQGTSAQFSNPAGLTIDAQDNLYVADFNNHRIRKVTPSGVVSTISGSTSGFTDGIGTIAQFFSPQGITIDTQGNLYVADRNNNKIRKITQE